MRFKAALLGLCIHFFSLILWAGPIIVGNGAGSEENQYVTLWTNREAYFEQCLKAHQGCGMNAQESATMQSIADAMSYTKTLLFFADDDFQGEARGLIFSPATPFVAYSRKPGKIIFNIDQMYDLPSKYDFGQKLSLLLQIGSIQAGLNPQNSNALIQKFVSHLEAKIQKFDLGVIGAKGLQIWLQETGLQHFFFIDDSGTKDFGKLLSNQLPCDSDVKNLTIQSAHWESYSRSTDQIDATFAGSIRFDCANEVTKLNFSLDLSVRSERSRWSVDPSSLRVHFSSLE
ncbi:MAG: hypothetical protein EOP04_15175 [Proteobacteria bacterium]|nr:MAG: hypothetical protein EOP04_15175 [Pseudomonadota bacterium]